MPRYIANEDKWLSHECRPIKAGEEFDTVFPTGPGGKPMILGDSITEIKAKPAKAPKPDDLV